jgi:hypothetical protein
LTSIRGEVLFYGYAYRWLRPKCYMDVPQVWEGTDPIRRQLLGACTTQNGYFDPQPGDVPLKAWIAENTWPGASSYLSAARYSERAG